MELLQAQYQVELWHKGNSVPRDTAARILIKIRGTGYSAWQL